MADVAVIIPFRNAARWLSSCLESVLSQNIPRQCRVQVSLYNDDSRDDSAEICRSFRDRFLAAGIDYVESGGGGGGDVGGRLGVGGAKNRAVRQSRSDWLCFLDADDEMKPDRLSLQLSEAKRLSVDGESPVLIGTSFERQPTDSTIRYSRWANSLDEHQLRNQIYTSFGPTLIAPTWFCSRSLFDRIGGFVELPKDGFPEDLRFFYDALRLGTKLRRIDDPSAAVVYRYHADCASFGVHEDTIRLMRVAELEHRVLDDWPSFCVWNAGRGGRKFYKALSDRNRSKLRAFVDVDAKKLALGYYEFAESKERRKPRIPIIRVEDARPPLIICVKLDMTDGLMEHTVHQLGFVEGRDFYYAG